MDDRPRAEACAVRLWSEARETDALCNWRAGSEGYMQWLPDTEVTALALNALLSMTPKDPRILKVVRWLMAQREGSHWLSTRDTAFILLAVADFVRAFEELKPDFTLAVRLNGRPLGQALHFGPDAVLAPQRRIEISPNDLRVGENILELAKTGPGNLFYSLRLSQYVSFENRVETIAGSGLRVERQYYKLSLRRDRRSGALELRPSDRPQTRFRAGDLVRVRLAVSTGSEMEYMMVEDPLPAGCEVLSRGDLYPWEWDRWYSDMDIHDRLVGFFARRLPAGRQEIEYDVRVEVPGRFCALPTEVFCMYRTDLRGTGAEAIIEVGQ